MTRCDAAPLNLVYRLMDLYLNVIVSINSLTMIGNSMKMLK